ELARDVYTCLQPDRGLGTSNSGLLNRGGGLVVDTFWDLPHTRQMIDTYARVWKAPARRVVNTHRNGDHCWGNQLFPDAEIIGHLPAERIVFPGDILFRLCTPIGWEGTYDRWIAALDRIVALAPDVVVPGHGPVCGLEGPREMKAYLQYVRAESKRLFDRGLSAVDAAKRIDLGPYAGWAGPGRIAFQVARAARELRGQP